MSDYMFMLESHLTGEQSSALAAVRDAAERENLNLFLTGGGIRDVITGTRLTDLDFTVEGPAVKFAKAVAATAGAEVVSVDDLRKSVELRFPTGVLASISMSHSEKFSKPGAKPQVTPSTIHEDLRCRDFTINAIALSLGKASRGLLLDPTNGLGDLECKEIRTVSNYTLYDDPSRILRMIRLKVRFGFAVHERTMSQYRNVREAKLETKITGEAWQRELRNVAFEPLSADIVKELDTEGLLTVLSPALAGPKLNLAGFQRVQKVRQSVPLDAVPVDYFALFLSVLFEKLTPRDRTQLIEKLGLEKAEVDSASKLDARATKTGKEIAAAKITRPSALYTLLQKVPGEILVYLLAHSNQRLVLDRIKNYLTKYLPIAKEVTEQDVIAKGGQPGTAKFNKLHDQLVAERLNARPKKVVVEEAPPPPPAAGPGRRPSNFAR